LRNLASSNVTPPIFNERVAQYSATASSDNPARSLEKSNPKAQQDELVRRVTEDSMMSSFDFGVQFLDPSAMTYWGKHYDADFWIKMPAWSGRKKSLHFIVWHDLPFFHIRICHSRRATQHTSTSPGAQRPTVAPWGASSALAGGRSQPVKRRACGIYKSYSALVGK
jgi:hypothetical protein